MMKSHLAILLLAIACVAFRVSAKEFTEDHTTDLLNGRVVKVNDRLVLVSVRKGSIHLTSPDADFKPCQINVVDDDSTRYHLKDAQSLGNGKIVLWSHGYKDDSTHWKLFIVDPAKCTSTTVKRATRKLDALNEINTLIPYQDSFDVFSSYEECSPCRYKDNGEPIDLPESTYKRLPLPTERNFDLIPYSIQPIGKDASSGYVLAQPFRNCSSLLKTLSPTFQVEKEQLIDRYVESLSTEQDLIRVCSSSDCLGEANSTHDCQLMDSGLRSAKPMERITERDSTFLKRVKNLPDGGAVAVYVSQGKCFGGDGEGSFADVYARRIHADGQVDSEVKFETVGCWNYDFDHFQLGDGRYCLIAYDGVNTGKHDQKVFIKCLKLDE